MSDDDKPISKAEFNAASLYSSRSAAIALITALNEGGLTLDVVEKRSGKKRGWGQRLLASLIDGSGSGRSDILDQIGTFAWSCDGAFLKVIAIPPEPRP